MVIKNNFNDKNAKPLNDYTNIGKGSHSLEVELEREKEEFIKENMDNPVLEKLRDNNFDDNNDDDSGDNWKLFR